MATLLTQPALEIVGDQVLVRPPKTPSDEVKEVLGGRWDKSRHGWLLPPTSMNMLTLRDWYGSEIFEGAPRVVTNLAFHEWGFDGWTLHDVHDSLDKRLYARRAKEHPYWDDLYDFQKEAVEYITCNPHRGAILALEPGLGKAPVAAVAMDIMQINRALVAAPLTLAKNWMREFDDWSQYYRSWSRATRTEKDPRSECVITNFEVIFEPHYYDEFGDLVEVEGGYARVYNKKGHEEWIRASPRNMSQWIKTGPKVESKRSGKLVPARKRVVEPRGSYDQDWDVLVIDESVLLKNRKAVKVDILGELAKYTKQVWLLSGSPTAKFRVDLYPQIRTIMPRGFKSYWRFAEFFCTIDRNQWGWKITGDRPDHDPRSYLRDFLFIRSQKEVLPELPDYIYDPIEVDLNADQQKAFKSMTDEWVAEIPGKGKVQADIALAQMTRLAQITSNMVNVGGKRSSAKEDLLIELIQNGEVRFPMIVWCWWVPTAHSVFDRLIDETDLMVDYVTGHLKGEEKDEAFDSYKQGRTDILVTQLGVGKFGHTLTDTRTVYYHDRHFDSDAYFQSLRRVRRIGLEHRPRLIVPRSIRSADPVIEANLSGKLQSVARLGNRDLKELLLSLGSGNYPWSMDFEQ